MEIRRECDPFESQWRQGVAFVFSKVVESRLWRAGHSTGSKAHTILFLPYRFTAAAGEHAQAHFDAILRQPPVPRTSELKSDKRVTSLFGTGVITATTATAFDYTCQRSDSSYIAVTGVLALFDLCPPHCSTAPGPVRVQRLSAPCSRPCCIGVLAFWRLFVQL